MTAPQEAARNRAIEEVARWIGKSGYVRQPDPARAWELAKREAEGLLFGEYGEPSDAARAVVALLGEEAPVEGDADFDATAIDYRRGSPQYDTRPKMTMTELRDALERLEHADGDTCTGLTCANPDHGWLQSEAAAPSAAPQDDREAEPDETHRPVLRTPTGNDWPQIECACGWLWTDGDLDEPEGSAFMRHARSSQAPESPEPLPIERLGLSDEQTAILRKHLASRQQTVTEFLGDVLMEYGLGRAHGKEYPPPTTERSES